MGVTEQDETVRVLPCRVGVGEESTDVALPRRTEDGVGDGMTHGVAVRMSREARRVRNDDATELQRPSRVEAVRVVAEADAPARKRPDCGSLPASGRGWVLDAANGLDVVVSRRDLDVAGISRHHLHAMAGALGERGFVGRILRAVSEGHDLVEDVAPETLRRLREVQLLAREAAKRPAPLACLFDPLHRVVHRDCRNRRAVDARGVRDTRDDVDRDERPRGVVHEHDRRVGGQRCRAVGHRVLTPGATGRHPPSLQAERDAQLLGARHIALGHDHDETGHIRGGGARRQGAREHRLRAERQPLLGHLAPETRPLPTGCHDHIHTHQATPIGMVT